MFFIRSVHDIDLFTAGLAEKPVINGLVGPTLACVIAQQFRALRRGKFIEISLHILIQMGPTPKKRQILGGKSRVFHINSWNSGCTLTLYSGCGFLLDFKNFDFKSSKK